jgi:hypothetical protein
MHRKGPPTHLRARRILNEDRTGLIVSRGDGFYLGHDLQWYEHDSLEEAYVHTANTVLEGGDWEHSAHTVLRSRPFAEFKAALIHERTSAAGTIKM